MRGPRVRFAPSPTGSLHLGNARTALFNWLIAKAQAGTFILRIEDTDTEREREGSEGAILEDLRWLGLTWDEGPEVGGAYGPYRQSERARSYVDAASRLIDVRAAFRCFCGNDEPGREPSAPSGPTPGHRDPCRSIGPEESARRAAAGEPHAIRFRVPAAADRADPQVRFDDRLHGPMSVPLPQVADAVLLRRDGRPTYNFAVVVDDAAMRIDLVVRGDDHLSNTPLQVLLYEALGFVIPGFAHVPMVLGSDGERLSKRHGATSVSEWRARGVPPEALINGLVLLGWAPSGDRTIVSVADVVAEFDLDRVGRSAAIFDPAKLEWISSQYIHAMDAGRLAREVGRALVAAGRIDRTSVGRFGPWVAGVAEFLRPSLARFDQVESQAAPLFHPGGPLGDDDRAALGTAEAIAVLEALSSCLNDRTRSAPGDWTAIRTEVARESGAKGKGLFQPIRIALMGHAHGRELDRFWPLIVQGAEQMPDVVPAPADRVRAALEAAR